MLKNDHRHQIANAAFKRALKHEVNDPFVSVFANVMRRRELDFCQVNLRNKRRISVVNQKVDENVNPPKHSLDERVENVARPRFHGFRFLRDSFIFRGLL